MRFKTIEQVVSSNMCVGCGACAFVSQGTLRMANVLEDGFRPVATANTGAIPSECLEVCPVVESTVKRPNQAEHPEAWRQGLGPVVAFWEVHATDKALRHHGASGGALSALALFALETRKLAGLLHIAQDADKPLQNKVVLSHSRTELECRTGSRYAPASLCERLDLIEREVGCFAVIGQPSEIAALRKINAVRPTLAVKIGITMSFFCAGSPSSQGTIDLIRSQGCDPAEVTAVRYRGRGWPGTFAVWVRGASEPAFEMTYEDSWAFLQKYRPWGVHLWPDGAGEHADISCGDPWYRKVRTGEAGSSLVLARNERGRAFVTAAIEAGYLQANEIGLNQIVQSQTNLLNKKAKIAGRIMAMGLLGRRTPSYHGYHLAELWRKCPIHERMHTIIGTIRRLLWPRRHPSLEATSPAFSGGSIAPTR